MAAKKSEKVSTPIKEIDAHTQITFTVKTFIALIGTILGIFFMFYQVVVVPKFTEFSSADQSLRSELLNQNKYMYDELIKFNDKLQKIDNALGNLQVMEDNAKIKREKMDIQLLKNGKRIKNMEGSNGNAFDSFTLPPFNGSKNYCISNFSDNIY